MKKEHATDSKREKLALQDILVQKLVAEGARGMELTKQILTVLDMLQMPQSEGAQIGNTVFVNKYSTDGSIVFMMPFNVDTNENYVGNVENMVRAFKKAGVNHVFTRYDDFATDKALNALKKLRLGVIATDKAKDGFWEARIDLKAK
jgi:hypothetical protein